MVRLRSHLAAAVALVALALPAAAQGRTTADILRDVSARARARTQGVQNYTINSKTMGMTLVSYVERDAEGAFQVQTVGTGEMAEVVSEISGWADEMLSMMENALAQGTGTPEDIEPFAYQGAVNSAGAPAHRFGMDGAAPPAAGMPRRMSIDFDTATFLTRRLEAEMPSPAEGGAAMRVVMELGDWRPVQGMLIPFRRRLVAHGMRGAMMGEDTTAAQGMLTQGRSMLAGLPPEEREGMRQMLAMIEGVVKRDEMVLDEIVLSVAVNRGRPAGMRGKND